VVRYCSSSLGWLETERAAVDCVAAYASGRTRPSQARRSMATRGIPRPCLRSRLPMSARDGARFCLCPTPRALGTIRLQQNGMGLRCVQGRVRFGRAWHGERRRPERGKQTKRSSDRFARRLVYGHQEQGRALQGSAAPTPPPRSSRRLQGVRIHWCHIKTHVLVSGGGRNIEGTPRSTSETTP
jgi:hypothetical protein